FHYDTVAEKNPRFLPTLTRMFHQKAKNKKGRPFSRHLFCLNAEKTRQPSPKGGVITKKKNKEKGQFSIKQKKPSKKREHK
ncbi:hypothetical protein M5Y68_09890, partial [Neisseria meningitidis]|nr:hypothetical protein [Neisseria meningitidis]